MSSENRKSLVIAVSRLCFLVLFALVILATVNDHPNFTLAVVANCLVMAFLDLLRGELFYRFTAAGWVIGALFWGVPLLF